MGAIDCLGADHDCRQRHLVKAAAARARHARVALDRDARRQRGRTVAALNSRGAMRTRRRVPDAPRRRRARGLSQTQERIEKVRGKLVEIEAETAKRANTVRRGRRAKEARASLIDPHGAAHAMPGWRGACELAICRLRRRRIMASSPRSWRRTGATTAIWCGRCSRRASDGSGGRSNGCWRTPASRR